MPFLHDKGNFILEMDKTTPSQAVQPTYFDPRYSLNRIRAVNPTNNLLISTTTALSNQLQRAP